MDQIKVRRSKPDMGEVAPHAACRVKGIRITERIEQRIQIAEILPLRLIQEGRERCPKWSSQTCSAILRASSAPTRVCLTNFNAFGWIGIQSNVRYRSHRRGGKAALIGRALEETADPETALACGRRLI